VQVVELPKQVFVRLPGASNAQGVVAEVAKQARVSPGQLLDETARKTEPGFLLIVDDIEDPHNLGALVRTAECAGVHAVMIPKHRTAHVTGTVVKAAAGATAHIPVVQITNVVQTIKDIQERGYWVVGLDAAGKKLFTEIDYSTPIALIVGNEGRGIRRLVREHCDHLVRIPLYGKIQSLNASVAGALVMYEVARARRARSKNP
jgi:23S rRNA (guanosine2251-2'-O)-methyltransferase